MYLISSPQFLSQGTAVKVDAKPYSSNCSIVRFALDIDGVGLTSARGLFLENRLVVGFGVGLVALLPDPVLTDPWLANDVKDLAASFEALATTLLTVVI